MRLRCRRTTRSRSRRASARSRARAPATRRSLARSAGPARRRRCSCRVTPGDVPGAIADPARDQVLDREDTIAAGLLFHVARARAEDIVERELSDELARVV